MNDGQSRRSAAPAVLFGLLLAAGAIWWLYPRQSAERSDEAAGEAGAAAVPWVASGEEEKGRPLLRLGAQASVAGKVVDEQGRPIAGARVCARAESSLLASSETRFARCSLSARDGHYRIDRLFGVRHRVVAGAPGFIPGPYVRGEGADRRETVELKPGLEALGIDITLRGGGVEIRGVVKDLSGGPIEGAQVTAEDAYAVTGVDGSFATWVRPGGVWMEASADGYTSGHDQGAAPGHAFEIYLTPESVLIGKVVRASDGSPIEGAKVSAGNGGGGWSRGSEFTDAAGDFRIAGLEPGAYKPAAESDDAYGLAEEQVILGLGETSQPLTITAHPATYVEGTVAVPGGDSCDAGSVMLHDRADDRWCWADINGDGTVRIQGVRPGTYEVQVECAKRVPAERYPDVVVGAAPVTGVRWEVSRGQEIRGVVVDAGGKPVEHISLGADAQPDPSKPRAQLTGGWDKTDASGRFVLAGLLPGAYKLQIYTWQAPRATPPKPLEVTLPAGKDLEDIRIELPATGEVRGRVRDAKGRAVARLRVQLSGERNAWQSAMAGDDGTFKFEHVAAGEYRVIANRGWSETMRAPGTTDDDVQGAKVVVRGGSVETVELVIEEAAGTIGGVVRDADGGPVADAFIEATRESDSAAKAAGSALRQGRWGNWDKAPHLTESDGRFSLDGLSAGKYTVRAHRKGGGEATLEHVALGSDVVLTIASTGRMAGTVVLRGGGAPEEFRISLEDEATGFRRYDGFYKTGGAWSFAELPAGKYKLRASAGGGSAEVEATMRAGEETAGVRIELAPRVTVRGKVVDTEGKPVPGVDVSIGGAAYSGGDADRKNITDEAGRFEVANAPTGQVRIWAWPNGDEYAWATVPARIEATGAEVELPTIELVRRRVKDGETAGDLGFKLKESEAGEDPLARRLLVAHVRAGGPAATAGLQVGDEVVRVDGNDVVGGNAYLFHGLTTVLEGTTVSLGLARGVELKVVAGKKP